MFSSQKKGMNMTVNNGPKSFELRHLEDWIDKARKITGEMEVSPQVEFKNEGGFHQDEVPQITRCITDVQYSVARNVLTFILSD
jgi:hypothetical protein